LIDIDYAITLLIDRAFAASRQRWLQLMPAVDKESFLRLYPRPGWPDSHKTS